MKRLLNWIESNRLNPLTSPLPSKGEGAVLESNKSEYCRQASLLFKGGIEGGFNLKAFSIIETITAMALLTITFGIAMSTFDMIYNTDNIEIATNAQLTLKQIIAETQQDKTYYDETIKRNGFTIEKTVQPYTKFSKDNNLIHLQVIATIIEQEKTIATINKLIEQ